MKKKTHRTHSTYSNYSPAHPPLCLQPLGLHNKMFQFETLLYHILVQNTLLPWCLITQECEWIPTNLVPKLLGSKTKCLIPQVATISCSSVSHLTLSQARIAKRATASNPLSAASIPCPFCHCLLPAWIG